jgi:hypothetical protein
MPYANTLPAPVLVETAHGEAAIFTTLPYADGVSRWEVGRPVREGWQAIGEVEQTPAGYVPALDCRLSPARTVTDAVAVLAARAAALDELHGYPPALATAPEDEPGLFEHLAGRVRDHIEAAATVAPA